MKKKLVMQGTIRFKKPDRFLMELAPPYSGKVLLKDTVLEQRLGTQGERQRIVLPPEQGLSRWFAAVAKPVTSVPEGMEVRAEQNGCPDQRGDSTRQGGATQGADHCAARRRHGSQAGAGGTGR